MLNYKRRDVVDSFWNDYNNAGFDQKCWRETSKDWYRYSTITSDNGELILEGLRQESSMRIPCAVPDVELYLWIKQNKKYMCLMFYEVGEKELYVHRYVARNNSQ